MSDEPQMAFHQPIQIDTHGPGVDRELPPLDQQNAADDVFTDSQGRFVAALMALQTGVGLVQLMADNNRVVEEPRPLPRKQPDPDQK